MCQAIGKLIIPVAGNGVESWGGGVYCIHTGRGWNFIFKKRHWISQRVATVHFDRAHMTNAVLLVLGSLPTVGARRVMDVKELGATG